MKNLATFMRYNPFRRPDWRWERILHLVRRNGQPGRCNSRDDDYIQEARAFMLHLQHLSIDDDRESLWMKDPGLFYAYNLYTRASDFPQGAAFLEARLLANQSHESIAECLSTIPSTVRWYESLFFNVTEYLKNRDWITAQILLPAIQKHYGTFGAGPAVGADQPLTYRNLAVAEPFLDASLKLFAYFGGPYLVDVMITGFQQGKPLTSPDDMSNWFDHHMAMTVRRRAAQASMQFEVNKYNVTELLTIHTRIMEIERSEDNQDQHRTTTERHIKAMIDEIPWSVGDQGEEVYKDTILGRFDKMPAELRDEEAIRIASGQIVPGLNNNFPDRLPPPRKKNAALLIGKDADL